MTNLFSSTNDPLFWLHHCQLDRLWAHWQGTNSTRLNDLEANIKSPKGLPKMIGETGKGAHLNKTSSETIIWMGEFFPSMAMGRVADTQDRAGGGVLCYRYEG